MVLFQDMDDFYEFYEFVQDVLERGRRLPRRYIRDLANPLDQLSERQFQETYRFRKRTVVEFLYPLMNRLSKPDNRGKPIPVMIKLLIALSFFATGIYQRDNGDIHGISQASVNKIVKEVAEILAGELRNYVRLPTTRQQQELTKQKFYGIRQFPGVVGCVDGTHIEIDSPSGNVPEVYRNRKTFFSLNVQVVAGPDLEIQDITVRYPGSFHDARIFQLSGLDILFERGDIRGIILGDSSYPCEPYLLTPVLNPTTIPECRYNEAHKATQNVVKRAIGVWKQRFRCLRRSLSLKLENTATVICATSVLHNIAQTTHDPLPEEEEEEVEEENDEVYAENRGPGLVARRCFINRHFSEQ